MLDVKEDQEASVRTSPDTPRLAASKPFLKFGVSAILGLDSRKQGSCADEESADTDDEEDGAQQTTTTTVAIKADLYPAAGSLSLLEGISQHLKPHPFHPAYLPPYFHPLIQQSPSQNSKTLSGESNYESSSGFSISADCFISTRRAINE